MFLYFDSNGKLIERLEHGSSPRAGTTDYEIFAYFEGVDLDFLYTSASITFTKPDLEGTRYPPLVMERKKIRFSKLENENPRHFTNGIEYTGFYFNFFGFDGEQTVNVILDTLGQWTATIKLYGSNRNVAVQGEVKFNVNEGVESLDGSEIGVEEIFDGLALEIAKKIDLSSSGYVKVLNELPAAGESFRSELFSVGDILFNKKDGFFYVIKNNLIVSNNNPERIYGFRKVSSDENERNFESKHHLNNTTNFYIGSSIKTPVENDYCFVLTDETRNYKTTKYVYRNGEFVFDTVIVNFEFDETRKKALNSGITSDLIKRFLDSIVKYNDITNVGNGETPIANLLDNTIVLDLATKKIKKYNKTANQTIGTFTDFVLADFDTKVNKTSEPRKIYGTNENGQPVLYSTIVCNPNSVVLYDSDGYLSTERTPSQNYHLTNKEYVDSQIKANASNYITKNASGNAFDTYNELENADTFYCGGVEFTPTKNDYCLVRDDETQGHTTTRYFYQNGQWEFQYVVNETPLTQAQLNAINSGITSALVSKLGYYTYDTNGNIVPINVNQSLGSEEQPYKYVWATRFRFTTDFYISKDTDYSIFINVNGKELHTNGNFTPTTDNTYNVGSKSFAWKNVFIKGYISNDTRSVRVEELQKSKKETTRTTLQNNETTLTSEEEMFITQPITTLVIDKLKDLDVGYAKSFAINFITGSTFSGITLPNKVQKNTFSVGANNKISGSSTEEDIICDFALGTPHLQPNTEYKLIIKKSVVSGNYLAYLI